MAAEPGGRDNGLRLSILGHLAVFLEGREIPFNGSVRKALLIRLALDPGHSVPTNVLMEDLWGDSPPANAYGTLQSHVSLIRRALGAKAVVNRGGGYLLDLSPEAVDANRFTGLVETARNRFEEFRYTEAIGLFEDALALWRGEALSDVSGFHWSLGEAARLEEFRLSALEWLFDCLLASGQAQRVAAEAESALAREPLREQLWAKLMVALYRCGRQADALRTYQRLRSRLGEDLGIEPSRELVLLEQAILNQDPSLIPVGHNGSGKPDSRAPEGRTVSQEAAVREAGISSTSRGELERSANAHKGHYEMPAVLRREAQDEFVGRSEALAVLSGILSFSSERPGGCVLISGEPGIGKTALVSHFALDAHSRGAIVLLGQAHEDFGRPFGLFADIVSQCAQQGLGGFPECDPRLFTLLDSPIQGDPSDDGKSGSINRYRANSSPDPENERFLLVNSVIDLMSRVAAAGPALVILEDLQWSDRPSLQLLRKLVVENHRVGIGIVATFRGSDIERDHPLQGILAALRRNSSVKRVDLGGLEALETERILCSLAPMASREEVALVAKTLHDEARGNPFFSRELVQHLIESGTLVCGDDGLWKLDSHMQINNLPASIMEVTTQRVERLGKDARSILEVASVMGTEFELEILAAVSGFLEDDVIEVLESAQLAQIVSESASENGRYGFVHALLQRAIYDSLSLNRASRIHLSVAKALELQNASSLEGELTSASKRQLVTTLAHHWYRSPAKDGTAKAFEYACAAADGAVAAFAPDEAVEWYMKAIELEPKVTPPDPARSCSLLISLGVAQRQAGTGGSRKTLLAASARAKEILRPDLVVRAAVANNRGFYSAAGIVDLERVAALEGALEVVGNADSPARARLLATLSSELTFAGDYDRRLKLADEALAIAKRLGDPLTIAQIMTLRLSAISVPDTLKLRMQESAEAIRLAEELGHRSLRFASAGHRALVCAETADLEGIDTSIAMMSSISQEVGRPWMRMVELWTKQWRSVLGGDLELAETLANQALEIGLKSHQPEAAVVYTAQIFNIKMTQGLGADLIELMAKAASDNPGIPVLKAAHILLASEFGDKELAGKELAEASTDNFAVLPYDHTWLAGIGVYSAAAANLGAKKEAAILFRLLSPWEDQVMTTGLNVAGPVATALAELATTLGDTAVAERFQSKALKISRDLKAPMLEERARRALSGPLSVLTETRATKKPQSKKTEKPKG